MVGGVGFFSVDYTKNSLMKTEGESSTYFANEVVKVLSNNFQHRILESKELAQDPIILNEVIQSNYFFDTHPDPDSLIVLRDNQWINDYSENDDFIFSSLNNPASSQLKHKLEFYSNELGSNVFGEIFVTNIYGVNVAQTGKTSDYLQSDESWWQLAKENGLHIGSLDFDESSEIYSIDISHKMIDSTGNFIGVMKAVLNSEDLFSLIEQSKVSSGSSNMELTLYNYANEAVYSTDDEKSEHIFPNFGNNKYGFSSDNSKFLSISEILSFPDSPLKWKIVVEQNPEELFAVIDSLITLISIITTIVAIASVAVGLIISRSIVLPLRILSKSSDKLASGKLDQEIVIHSDDEFGELGKKFEHMRKELQEKNKSLNEELKIQTKRLVVFKQALDKHSLVSITDINGNIVYVNEKFCDVSKYNAEELLGKNHRILKSDHHPKEFFEGIWSVITKGGVWKGDIKNRAKDGTTYWVKSIIAPLYDDFGNIEQFIAIRTDITSQKLTEEKLQTALEEIQEHEKMKDEFSSMISHELKTPLTPIRGYCELLKMKLAGPVTEKQVEVLERVELNVDKLERLIGDVLDSQKLDLKKMVFDKKPLLVNNFMEKIVNDLKSIMDVKEVKFVNTSKLTSEITTDEIRLGQVLTNLIRNSVDFVPEKTGVIEIGANEENNTIVFYVKDNGIGISKENQQKLFTKFYQIDTSARRKHGGTGLGLVICKGIIEGLGGKIWMESDLGKGTTVFFSIPKTAPLVEKSF